jgi:hypothetical protein
MRAIDRKLIEACIASENERVVRSLIDAGAEVNLTDRVGQQRYILCVSILRLFQEVEFEIDEVRFDEVEGAFEIERQSLVGLHDKRDFQIATHQFFKELYLLQ